MVIDTLVTDDYGVLQAINSYRTARYKELKRVGLNEPGVMERNLLSMWANADSFSPFNNHPVIVDACGNPMIQMRMSQVASHIRSALQSYLVEVQLTGYQPGMLTFKVNHHDPRPNSPYS